MRKLHKSIYWKVDSASRIRILPICELLMLVVFLQPSIAQSDEAPEQARVYVSRAERRDAATGYEVNDWLSVGFVADLEYSNMITRDEFSKGFEIGAEIQYEELISGKVLYEYDGDVNDQEIDEASIQFSHPIFDVEFGRMYLPFGEFHSRFASGPLLEFAETRADAIEISHDTEGGLEGAVFFYKGRASRLDSSSREWNWGASASSAIDTNAIVGLSYLSDLADAGEFLLSDFANRYRERVDAITGYIVVGIDSMEVTFEFVRALGSFEELEPDEDQPRSWNLEYSIQLSESLDFALRREESANLSDLRTRTGCALSWRIDEAVSATFEYLYGTSAEPNQNLFGVQVSFEL